MREFDATITKMEPFEEEFDCETELDPFMDLVKVELKHETEIDPLDVSNMEDATQSHATHLSQCD